MAAAAGQPECDVTSQVTEAVQCEDWTELSRLIEQGHLSELSQEQRNRVVNETCTLCQDLRCLRLLVRDCEDDMLEIIVRRMVIRGMWSVVGEALQRGVSESWVICTIQEACEQASEKEIISYILPHCTDNELNVVLTPLMRRGLWQTVGAVLKRGDSDSQCRWVIDEACKHTREGEITAYLLPHCVDNQLDCVLTLLVERGLWKAVGLALKSGVSDSQRRWAFEEACKQPSEWELTDYILPHFADNQLDSVLTPLVERGRWRAVGKVLERGVSDSRHRWATEEAFKQATCAEITCYILRHCADNQLDSVLTPLVERGLWEAVGTVLQRGVSDSQRKWAIEEACKQASGQVITQCILPHCANNEMESVLTRLVERGLGRPVGKVLQRGVSDSKRRWAINEICNQASGGDIAEHIIPQCKDKQLDYVLTPLVKRCLWTAVGRVLRRGVSDKRKEWAIDEACQKAPQWAINLCILPLCPNNLLGSVLVRLVERGLWSAVGTVLQRGVSDPQRKRAIDEACRHASAVDITDYILCHCVDNQLDSVLKTLVKRGLWSAVGTVLQRGVGDPQRRWAIDEACERACDGEITNYILPHCVDNQLDSVLTPLVGRGLWIAVGTVLERGVSDSRRRWAIKEACETESGHAMSNYILPLCADNQLDSVVKPLVERRLWKIVGMVLKRGVSTSQQTWAFKKACEHASEAEITDFILPNCAEIGSVSLLKPLVKRGLWRAVGKVTQRGFIDSQSEWATNKACKRASEWDITNYILPHRTGNQLISVLTSLVKRSLWRAVGMVLERGVSDLKRRWTIDEACKYASEGDITNYILPHCVDNHLDSVLTSLMERGLWRAVGTVLERGVSNSQFKWVADEACKNAHEEEITDLISLRCAANQLDSVLTPLMERGLWGAVGKVLKRGVSDYSQRRRAIDEACKRASEQIIMDYIVPLCADSQLDSVLTPLTDRGLWEAVGTVLQRGVSGSQRMRVINEACKHAPEPEIAKYILLHCIDNQLDSVLTALVERGLWSTVGSMFHRNLSDSKRRWAIDEACKRADNADVELLILTPLELNMQVPKLAYDSADALLTQLIKRGLWKAAATLLYQVVSETLYRWATVADNTEPEDAEFWKIVRSRHYGLTDLFKLCQFVRGWRSESGLSKSLYPFSSQLCTVLIDSTVESVLEAWFSSQNRKKECELTKDPSQLILHLDGKISPLIVDDKTGSHSKDSVLQKLLPCIRLFCTEFSQATHYEDISYPLFTLLFNKFLIEHYYTHDRANTEAILVILATVPVVPDVQSVALRVMLRHKRWDVISHACLTHVWEQDRRQLFQAAVEQRQWSVVKRWADHSLYDDQRGWALEEAFREKQWDVFLQLADYGLLESELMCVHYRLAKHADWETVLQMFERGADVTDMKELLTGAKSRKGPRDENDALKRRRRVSELAGLKRNLSARKTDTKALKRAVKQGDWCFVLFSIQRRPIEAHVHLALKAALNNGVWHVVKQLVKFGIEAAHRDSLFTRMVERQQWGACMVLLEQGVILELCLAALPELMAMDQWTLVARVMDYNVDDVVRRQVMQRAMERRQGSVVWQCIITMHGDRLSVEEKNQLFKQALTCQILQAIKPLIEEKNDNAIQRRDTVMLEAIEQHQWDVVDHCQLHRADIDMKDAEGNTPMHRAARQNDWEAVQALTKRGADSSLLDSGGHSVLHRALTAKQWNVVKLLITFHGDVHQAAEDTQEDICKYADTERTPLQMLIDARQGEIIEHTFLWCPDQWKGVNEEGETTLHAVCLSGWPGTLYYLVARGVNPLAVTKTGHSALSYAVLCRKYPQKMVAECIKLGLCTHQPHITDIQKPHFSPFVLAVIRGLRVVMRMLYEAGSCSYTELFRLRTQLQVVGDSEPWVRQSQRWMFLDEVRSIYFCTDCSDEMRNPIDKQSSKSMKLSDRYLMKVCTTPRSLKSSCRLVISGCVKVRRQRHRDAVYAQLPLSREMRNYVMFSDLTDPDYGQDETDGDEEHTDDNSDNGNSNYDVLLFDRPLTQAIKRVTLTDADTPSS